MPDNHSVYELPGVVQTYLRYQTLTKGEQILLQSGSDFKSKLVLDIGIGGGRTTRAVAGETTEYRGVDYSCAMVDACRAAFPHLPQVRFAHDDARVLATCPDGYFDTALFAFNGIDCIDSVSGREAALGAVCRVLKPGGVFIFSFHNAGYLDTLYRYHWQKNPLRWWANLTRMRQIRAVNGPKEQYAAQPFFFIRDGGENFRLNNGYARPSAQLRQLEAAGFQVDSCVASLSGRKVPLAQPDEAKDCWLYYRCIKA